MRFSLNLLGEELVGVTCPGFRRIKQLQCLEQLKLCSSRSSGVLKQLCQLVSIKDGTRLLNIELDYRMVKDHGKIVTRCQMGIEATK